MTIIQILGMGCPKCRKLTENAETAAKKLGIPYEIKKVTDIYEIMKWGVMMTPAIVVNSRLVSQGKLLTPEEIEKHLH